jgi:ATP/maltotriose-dependent transcriptional regulator MalT
MGIVRTKLAPPIEPGQLVNRPRLLDKILEVERARLTVLFAPAGYGKSSLLSQWHRGLHSPINACGWLTVDGTEGDGIALLLQIAAAISNAGMALEPKLDRILQTDVFASTDFLTTVLVQALESFEGKIFLFIDDAHLLPPEPMAALGRLVERAPANISFIVASRTVPDLHMARRRARGELLEIHVDDLKFTAEEMRRFLAGAGSDLLEEKDISALEQRTEGWIAGIKLATLALRRGTPARDLLASFTGSNRSVSEFFAEEVFSAQRPEVRDFLLKTSVLDRFCPDLCEAVTGRIDARNLLYEIEEKGLFLLQLDQESTWYRYHHLFAGFLQRRLAEQDSKLKEDLHLRASHWFWDAGSAIDAIEYAQKAGTMIRAAELLERRCQDLNYVGKVRLVAKFAGQIPSIVLQRYPGILLTQAWRLTRNLRFKEASELIALADARLREMASTGEIPEKDLRRLRYLLQHRQMVLAGARDEMTHVEEQCRHLLEEYPEEQHPYLQGNIYSHLIAAQRELYKLSGLERIAATACGMIKGSAYSQAAVGLQASIGPSLFAAGQTLRARQVLEHGREESLLYSGPGSSATAACSLSLSELAYENDELDLAERLVYEGLASARECGFIDQLQAGFLTLARVQAGRGDVTAALATLDEGMAIAIERDLMRLRLALTSDRVRLLIQSGGLEKARVFAESEGIVLDQPAPLPTNLATTRDELRAVIWVRIAQASDRCFPAIAAARHWRTFCAGRGAVRSSIRWNLLRAQLHFLSADHRAAQRALREALTEGAGSRNLRSFLDEGPLMRTLLHSANAGELESPEPADLFAKALLARFDGTNRKPSARTKGTATSEGLYGQLSRKEREILSLVGSGMSNREVAARIGMTEGTVKWYLQQVYDKVGTRRRQHAVQRARQFGLIASS